MAEATRKLIAETKGWSAYLVGEKVEIEYGDERWVIPAENVPEIQWLLDKLRAYLSLTIWERS